IELAWRKGGFYRSADGGETWEKQNDYISGGTGPHYYQEIYASPHRFDRVYQMDVRINWTDDGGKNFQRLGEEHKHSDNHAIAFHPDDPDYLLVGSDGGLYETWDHGKNWRFVANLPLTQFYKVAVDYDEPFYNIYGGTQDNSTQGGPSRTDNVHGIRNSDWFITVFADGHQPAVDPTNPDIIYSEWQQGNLVRHDRKTGEIVYLQPQPEKGAPAERWNWDSPILISPHDPSRLYFASQRVWQSDDRGDSWRAISGDLSHGRERVTMPMMGRAWSIDAVWDLGAMSNYGNVTSLAESPLAEGLIYAGTDDGLIQVTEDGGANWRRVDRVGDVPEGTFVNDIKADLYDADTAYAVLDNHKRGDLSPYVLKSTDRGRTWRSIAGDLPERHIVWRIVQDHERPELFFVGTEFGVFFTIDGGSKWVKLTGGVPNIPFRDLAIQKRENDLVGATFGRSFYVFDDYTPLRRVSAEMLEQQVELFPVRDAWWYIPRRPFGDDGPSDQGAAFFTAPNPPFGAVFTYYLKEELETQKQSRQKKEKEIAKEGGDTPFPGWDVLQAEEEEEKAEIVLTVRDKAGDVVRRIAGPAGSGFHRVAWDLHYPTTNAVTSLEPAES
ncbi:MAG: glycosyl hydrolase, partial [Thermoanaerobaculia bacterium]